MKNPCGENLTQPGRVAAITGCMDWDASHVMDRRQCRVNAAGGESER